MSGKRKQGGSLLKRIRLMFGKRAGAHKRLATLLAVLGLAAMSVGFVGAPAQATNDGGNLKVYVCKYVGKPGVDERLQTGQNPISVSVNSIPDYQGVGSYFADQHGRSFVLAEDVGQPEPDASACPPPDVPKDACPDLDGIQPPGTDCTQPANDRETRDLQGVVDCQEDTYTVQHQERTREYSWDGDSWEPGPWSDWTTYDTTVTPATDEQCPTEESSQGILIASSTDCELIAFSASGVKPEGATVVFKVDGVVTAQGTEAVAPGSHTVDLYVNGQKVDSKTITVAECPSPPTDCTKFQDENAQEPCYVSKSPVTRVEIGTAKGCKLHGVGGVETTTEFFTTTYAFNEATQQWVASEAATSSSKKFVPYTKAELQANGCTKSTPPHGGGTPPGLTGAPHTGPSDQGGGVPSRLPWFVLGLGLMGAAYSIARKAGVPA
jgi:hypothetical protein